MQAIVWALTIVSALGIIGLVLIQHGKGADVGAAFGSGSAGSLFGSSGAANFLSRTTAALAAVFFVGCLLLTYMSVVSNRGKGVLDRLPPPTSAPSTSGSGSAVTPSMPANAGSTAVPGSEAPAAAAGAPAQSSVPNTAAPSADGPKSQEIPK